MLINRREPYEPGTGMHRLWFSTGGSAGHSCLVGLDVFEGVFDPGGKPREWNVNVVKPRDVISAEQERKEEAKEKKAEQRARTRLERNRRKLAYALHQREGGDTLSALADSAGLSRSRAKEAMEVLVERGTAVACKVIKGNNKRELDGYMLASRAGEQDDPDTRTE